MSKVIFSESDFDLCLSHDCECDGKPSISMCDGRLEQICISFFSSIRDSKLESLFVNRISFLGSNRSYYDIFAVKNF